MKRQNHSLFNLDFSFQWKNQWTVRNFDFLNNILEREELSQYKIFKYFHNRQYIHNIEHVTCTTQ